MKNYPFFPAILIVFLLLSNQIQCQWNDWSDPIELTSSNSNNENAKVGYLRFTENDFYVFWERWIDSSSTDVVYKKFYDSDEVMILQSESNVHFKNPHHIHAYNSSQIDTNFIVLYEEDSKGYTDIAYQVYTSEGFTNPEYLTSSNNPKTGLKASYSGDVVWMEENKVMFMRYYRNNYEFSDPFVLDSGNCSYPTVIHSV